MSRNIPPDFASELSRLMDKHRVERRTARAALKGQRGRSKSPRDVLVAIEIARLAEGIRDPLQDFMDNMFFDEHEVEKVKHCTAARFFADHVKGNSRDSKIERLRRDYRKNEKDYKRLAGVFWAITHFALRCAYLHGDAFDSEIAYMDQNISILQKNPWISPWISWYILEVALPRIYAFREELRARARELDKEIATLLKRREELEIIQRWHAIASFEGLAVSEGTGKKQLQEAMDGINVTAKPHCKCTLTP